MDYAIQAGLIWVWNCCPGSDTWVVCHGWTVHCGAGGLVPIPGGAPIFGPLPFRGDSLETKKEARELRLMKIQMNSHFLFCIFSFNFAYFKYKQSSTIDMTPVTKIQNTVTALFFLEILVLHTLKSILLNQISKHYICLRFYISENREHYICSRFSDM